MTPRTNKLIKELGGSDNSVFADFTRQLERELNHLQKIINDATVSKCCGAKMIVSGGKDGTRWHECTKCGGACDGYINMAVMPNAGADAPATKDL